MFSHHTIVVLCGTGLLGACAGMVGVFTVLRGRALIGDALAHAALPGLCLAFLIVERRSLPALLTGALVSGVLGTLVVSALHRFTRIREDAAIGIVLSVFYGFGIVLTRLIQNRTTSGSKAGLASYIQGTAASMIEADVYLVAGVSAFCLITVMLLYKEFKAIAFDSGFATVQGWPVLKLDLLLTSLVALTVVIGLPAVGVVLISALLIIPASAARFWTNRLGRMLAISAVVGAISGSAGTLASDQFDKLPTGPVIVLVATACFLMSLLLAPERGLIARSIRQFRFRRRLEEQKVLRKVFEMTAPAVSPATVDSALATRSFALSTAVDVDSLLPRIGTSSRPVLRVVRRLANAGLVENGSPRSELRLTPAGRNRMLDIVRGYRLRNQFITDYPELAGAYADMDSETIDDQLPRDMLDRLEQELRDQGRWPN